MTLTLIIGGTRSGKSAHAEGLAHATGRPVRYVATASPTDPEMEARIAAHQARRPPDWATVVAGPELVDALDGAQGECVLIDGLGTWIAGALHAAGALDAPEEDRLAAVRAKILGAIDRLSAAATGPAGPSVIVVAEESGQGVLPMDRSTRAWLDMLGEARQRLSARAERVELVVAGRALALPQDASWPESRDGSSAAHEEVDPFIGASEPVVASGGPAGALAPSAGASEPHANLRRHGDAELRPGDADHAVNVLSGGPPAWLRAALHAVLDEDAAHYPREAAAIAALAALHGRRPGEVLPTNGAAEALWILPSAFSPRLAAVLYPGFTEPEASLHAHGVPMVRVLRDPDHDFAIDPAAVPAEADLVIVGNPASPSGTLARREEILALRRPGRVLIVDEAFMDLVPGEPQTLVREPLEDVVVIRSLTKSLSVPGLRAGYAVSTPALIQRLAEVKPPWSANVLALAALTGMAERPQALAEAAARSERERGDLERRLARVPGLRTWPAAANFVLVEVPDGPAVLAGLRAQAIAVRPAGSFPGLGPRHLRLTSREPEANERLVAALEAVLESIVRAPSAAAGR
jgi:histidinol-phosphate/aromatic aminotransferase/cobyric acid decarboxylase-like protein/adenosyl cobinamide kinase/adenosyl cobinamide phosphate guanylyltransferase